MANPTTNFGWVMPTSTDLVTDLPADFNVFGQGVDTTMADLKGGTTGQILSKATNTDMDFVWIANDQGDITGVTAGTGISGGGTSGTVTVTNSMATAITTAGDTLYGTGAGTFSRLGIGTAGQVLTVNGGATAPSWATPAGGGGMTLINTGGTAFSTSSITIGSIPNTYKTLFLVWVDVYASALTSMCCRMNTDTAANYSYSRVAQNNATGSFAADNASTFLELALYAGSTSTNLRKCFGTATFTNYTATSEVYVSSNYIGYANTTLSGGTAQGNYNNSAAITSITLKTDTAQTWSGGTAYLYGVN